MKLQLEETPRSRTVGYVFLFVWLLMATLLVPSVWSDVSRELGQEYGPHFLLFAGVSGIFCLAGFVGMALKQKWGVYLYWAMTVMGIVYLLVIGTNPGVLVIFPMLVALAGISRLKKMH
jgi:hypothetical protein